MFYFVLLGCTTNGKIAGEEWEAPASIVFDISQQDRMMLVMSDLPSLCAELSSGQQPFGDYWVLSLWTQNRSLEPGEYNADGYFKRIIDEQPSEQIPQSAEINLTGIEEERRFGRFIANFEGDDFLMGHFDAQTCPNVYLFLGMEN